MLSRKLLYLYSLIVFAPSVILFLTGCGVIYDEAYEQFGLIAGNKAALVLQAFGLFIGLFASFMLTCDLAGNPLGRIPLSYKRSIMVVGVVSGFFMNRWIGPSTMFWIPQLIGSIVLIVMSFIIPVTFKPKKL
ncbi:hypothetical protein [Reinekea marinisedimentorum]|uniref:Uncharacterized protein n=1 Tax=Reinekea marinisedimentorum TaxID=230495 RepID=A0A4R3IAD5_9GAMM|nr:hypothetical protein [Reinekea marinisedimentorum]TCS43260.1 hypothetical protein BCF53_102286 [Reinekea marinisedimentorum]